MSGLGWSIARPAAPLLDVVSELAVIVTALLVVATLLFVGPRTLLRALRDGRWRVRVCLPPLSVLAVVLLVRVSTRDVLTRFSERVVGVNITPHIFALESALFPVNPVVALQSLQTDLLTAAFVHVYLYGYVFLILFPVVAYFVLDTMEPLRTLFRAYAANYAIGLLLYTVFVVFGPRNTDPNLFGDLLYVAYPNAQFLTSEVNDYTNVFPSLHTSISMTVLLLAWQTRDSYPAWLPVAGVMAVSVALSTMYLGIHWFTDVVAGTALAVLSVRLARTYTVPELGRPLWLRLEPLVGPRIERLRATVGGWAARIRATGRRIQRRFDR